MSLLEKFILNNNQKKLFTKKDKLLIATSGGIDSVVLCQLCAMAGYHFGIAHCNFQLRGAASDSDEKFVASLAAQWQVPYHVVGFDTRQYTCTHKCSTQVAARNLRYNWFETLKQEHGYSYVLTAHHADDNIETVWMRFCRGTGIAGLTGIPEKKGSLIRPLLFARRAELEAFLQAQQLTYVQDESNEKNDYTRNYFRNTVLPMIEKVYPEAKENMLHNIERLSGVATLYEQAVAQHKKKLLTVHGHEVYLPVALLQQIPALSTVLYEIIKDYHFNATQVPEVMALLDSDSGKYILSATHRILKNRKHLIITAVESKERSIVIIEGAGSYAFTEGTLIVKPQAASAFSIDATIATVDAGAITFPLQLRPWRTGDYFYPLGMPKKKKLSRFFIDKKLSLAQKEKIWVVEMNKKIIWVVGHRIDDRFKITPQTQSVLQLQVEGV